MEERWEVIPTYPDYKISTTGKVYSNRRKRLLKPYQSNSVELFNESGSSTWTIPTLMGCTFLGNDITDPFRNRIMFKDGDLSNINLDNLYVEDTSDLPGEEWKSFVEYAGNALQSYYMISNKGRIKTCRHMVQTSLRGRPVQRHTPDIILRTSYIEGGYLTYRVHAMEGKDINITIHRAVAYNFCPNDNPEVKIVVNHKDGNKLNNDASNLEWCSPKDNIHHAISTGLLTIDKSTFTSCTVIHKETGKRYESMSEASRAMGKWYGYISERTKLNRPYFDKYGNEWTFEFVDTKPKSKHKNLFNINA